MSVRRTRVLHIIQNLNYGGMERLLADIVRGVDLERFESHVLVLQYLGQFAAGLDDMATLHESEPMGRWSMIWPHSLIRQIRGIHPDVVHTHSGVWYKATLAARMAGVARVIHTEHGRHFPDPWRARFFDGLAARRTDVAVAVSESVRDKLESGVVRGVCRVQVVLNGVDTERYQPIPDTGRIRNELGIARDVPILGSIGRLELIKGYDVMVEAFARMRAAGRADGALIIAGDGGQRPALQRQIADLGLSGKVHLLGWRDDVNDLLSAFDLFTMSSRSEGTSVSLLEAMSSGLCPVVTDVGGNAAVLGAELAHRLVPSERPELLAQAWVGALQNVDRRRRDADGARKRVFDTYGARAMICAYQKLYEGRSADQPALAPA